MKVRIKGNSLRLRLTQSDVQALASVGGVSDSIQWSLAARLDFRLEVDAGAMLTSAMEGQVVRVRVPAALAERWIRSDDVGIYAEQKVAEGQTIQIAVEKDFACLDGPPEENVDAFPHPHASCAGE